MKQLIALAGRPNVGKTATINKAYKLLLAKYPDAKEIERKGRVEIQVVISINKKRIGIASKGDRRKDIEAALDIFAKHKCEIILCAARTSGDPWDAILEFGANHKYEINCLPKIAESIELQERSNNKCARLIIEKIEALFKV